MLLPSLEENAAVLTESAVYSLPWWGVPSAEMGLLSHVPPHSWEDGLSGPWLGLEKPLLLSRSACVVYLPNKGTDLYLVYTDNASAAIDSVVSNSVLLHQGEAANQAARAQPLPRLTATVDS